MIVDFDELAILRGKVAMVDGGFDPLHFGHILYFREARESGFPVFCNVSSDSYVSAKHRVLIPQDERCKIIDELKSVDYVHPSNTTSANVIDQVEPRIVFKGIDWRGKLPVDFVAACERRAIEIRFVNSVINSSTDLMKAFSAHVGLAEDIVTYEEWLHQQRTHLAEDFDSDYYHSRWRADSNAYTIAERRRIEGKNPALIRDVFSPKTVLDMGCGPGALMYLLHEIGISADGVDFAQASKDLAPSEVRDRIRIGSVTDIALPNDSYELVVCREVLEHLRVLDIQKAVQNLCRISSKFVYVTTRFHPRPSSLFDVATEFEVDPTHISLMHIQLLRLMFVLQGMRRRRDLEEKMDWLNKGRVLIYEKVEKAF